jgi:S-adenosylmethionine:tRNA ribosyltransferase-isomerase
MKLSDYDYNLPLELIAQEPMEPRDHSRLLVLDKKSEETEHKHFYNIVDYLNQGDVLVMNNSKVFPARLIGKRKETGGKIEIFLLRHLDKHSTVTHPALQAPLSRGDVCCRWQCMVGGKRARPGLKIIFPKNLEAELIKDNNDQTWEVEFNISYDDMMRVLDSIGEVPLPPYIKRQDNSVILSEAKESRDSRDENEIATLAPLTRNDKENYQTVYADENKVGSVAAPTAGFHFTPELLSKIKKKGVHIEYVTLHVGLGTFAPVKVEDITKHKMHAEWVEVKKNTLNNIIFAKKEKRRVIAVGTTSCRTLEAVFSTTVTKSLYKGFSGFVNIFIYPGYQFKVVDALITNFHLPKSTLMMLVSALAGKSNIDKAYAEAIKQNYRFYSYGDAMFIE